MGTLQTSVIISKGDKYRKIDFQTTVLKTKKAQASTNFVGLLTKFEGGSKRNYKSVFKSRKIIITQTTVIIIKNTLCPFLTVPLSGSNSDQHIYFTNVIYSDYFQVIKLLIIYII